MEDTTALILETSTPAASLALVQSGKVTRELSFTSDRNHNAQLFAPLAELLGEIPISAVNLVLVGSGPGSYSGTRVGIAAAQGTAIAASCPAIAVPSILAIPSAEQGNACLMVGDARRGAFWTARVDELELISPPQITDAEDFFKQVEAAIAAGESVISFEKPDRFPLPEAMVAQVKLEFPTAGRLWQAWLATPAATRSLWAAASPQPIYLKPPHITAAKRSWLIPPGASAARP
ncbi:tRNA (adenosine(37)-N6)-threonylcarbamoyltransferase complex dimerization subunit type 1 TsaB [Luteolibacter pohnpeiensis]|uniref:tRNA (Adenosine(37)-N6)-threonylcarbamoyltransferase complex dimerization subunit type 1 TsaB n=1 Tax=Luteolibacter pohnpeiensis TaxID=454153 RepID=A0A934SC31_9BACT|nr:tRNA (adenosine(37)-N6)-threonylcarbamoyltransferase complex dimerization subunit type 1 TsaB [Luteolibacter pohnpeiensis]MBK1883164.1 tRNA (adenosine(37)-N6)-threonylcarbamoyltransferase complex dimerization subunit type 1 TsaB [Luteolibacter pohnpeiensis]